MSLRLKLGGVFLAALAARVPFHLTTGFSTDQVSPLQETVTAEDIVHIGYYSRCRILVRDGLVSPEAVSYNRGGRYLDLILELKPAWVGAGVGSPISGFITESRFLASYALTQSFPNGSSAQYNVYRRIE